MKEIVSRFDCLLGWALFASVFGGCFSDDDSSPCNEGTEGCACYPNSKGNPGLCQTPLVCVKVASGSLCEAPPDGSTVSSTPDASRTPDSSTGDATETASDGASAEGSMGTETGSGADGSQDSGGSGGNLVTNGNFSMGQTNWGIVGGSGTITTPTGQLCVSVVSGGNAILGWPEPTGTPGVALSPGGSYTLSYSAMATPAVTVDAKLGHTTSPYTSDFETPTNSDAVSTSFSVFTHPFTAPMSPA